MEGGIHHAVSHSLVMRHSGGLCRPLYVQSETREWEVGKVARQYHVEEGMGEVGYGAVVAAAVLMVVRPARLIETYGAERDKGQVPLRLIGFDSVNYGRTQIQMNIPCTWFVLMSAESTFSVTADLLSTSGADANASSSSSRTIRSAGFFSFLKTFLHPFLPNPAITLIFPTPAASIDLSERLARKDMSSLSRSTDASTSEVFKRIDVCRSTERSRRRGLGCARGGLDLCARIGIGRSVSMGGE